MPHPALNDDAHAVPLRVRVAAGILAYLAYAGFACWTETASRLRFSVPSRAEIASTPEGRPRARAEVARERALQAMNGWPPYAIWSGVGALVSFVATLAALVVSVRWVWRQIRAGHRHPEFLAMGVLLATCAPFGILHGPILAAQAAYEQRETSFVPAPTTEQPTSPSPP